MAQEILHVLKIGEHFSHRIDKLEPHTIIRIKLAKSRSASRADIYVCRSGRMHLYIYIINVQNWWSESNEVFSTRPLCTLAYVLVHEMSNGFTYTTATRTLVTDNFDLFFVFCCPFREECDGIIWAQNYVFGLVFDCSGIDRNCPSSEALRNLQKKKNSEIRPSLTYTLHDHTRVCRCSYQRYSPPYTI